MKISRMEKIIQEQTWHIVEERHLLVEKLQQVDDLTSIVPFEYATTPDRAMMRRNRRLQNEIKFLQISIGEEEIRLEYLQSQIRTLLHPVSDIY